MWDNPWQESNDLDWELARSQYEQQAGRPGVEKDAVRFYLEQLAARGLVNEDELHFLRQKTRIEELIINLGTGVLYFRFETETRWGSICQYVTLDKGELQFRDSGRWFVPGDILFDTFKEALAYLIQQS